MSIYRDILKDGLMSYRFKKSKYKPEGFIEAGKGAVFTFYSKENMVNGIGTVVTSVEAIEDNAKYITHWTPNTYRYGTYVDENRKVVKGHTENNLKQINTFYVDFDSDSITHSDILLASLDLGFMPTFIVKTDRGYQAYFVLDKPAFVTKHSQFKVIDVAKAISKNIRLFFQEYGLPVDLFCNHFGIARFPYEDNIVTWDKDTRYSFGEWLDWSMKQENYGVLNKKDLTVLTGTASVKQVDEPWYKLLLKQSHIKGKKGLIGRNNVLFTLALACFSSGITYNDCVTQLVIYNNRLSYPLPDKEYQKIIKSAYSGEYSGASRDYVLWLCREWVDSELTSKDLFVFQRWQKFKKHRSQRVRSHYDEWENDVLNYLSSNDSVYITVTKKALKEAINIPERTLDTVLSRLKKKQLVLWSSKKGRQGGLKLSLVKKVCVHIMSLKNQAKAHFLDTVANFIDEQIEIVQDVIFSYIDKKMPAIQLTLWDVDVG